MASGSDHYPYDLNRVAVYLRKSRADLEAEARGEGETLSKHRRTLMTIAKKYRYGIEDVYEELVSGERIVDRPEMQKLLHSVGERRYSAVLCMDMDRLGRGNMIDQGLIQEAFKSSGTLIITPRKVYDLDDEMDEEWSEFEAFMARRELKIITRRLQRGRRDSARDGRHVGKHAPYGYLRDDSLRLYPNPETAPVVQLVFEMASRGEGATAICNRLMDMGVQSPKGGRIWEQSTIYSILQNPVYRGHIVWGIYKNFKSDKNMSGRAKIRLPEEEWTVHENAHEALVDSETWERYLSIKNRTPKVSYGREMVNPLSSIVRCAVCGHAMRYRPGQSGRRDRLVCATPRCTTSSTALELVHDRVIETLSEILKGMRVEAKMQKQRRSTPATQTGLLERRIGEIDGELDQLNSQKNNLHDLLERQIYDAETFVERMRSITERIEAAEEKRNELQANLEHLQATRGGFGNGVEQLRRVLDAYQRTDSPKLKNDLLKQVVDRIIYRKEKDWRGADNFELEVFLRV